MNKIIEKLNWRKPDRLLLFLLSIIIFYILILLFLVSKKYNLQEQIYQAEVAIPWMQQTAPRFQVSSSSQSLRPKKDNMSLATRVSALSKRHGLKEVKLSSSGGGKVTLNFNTVNFVRLHDVIFNLEHRWNVKVVKADFKKLNNKPGLVSGSLILIR